MRTSKPKMDDMSTIMDTFRANVLNEYVQNEIAWLKKYLTMDEEEQNIDLAYMAPHALFEFLSNTAKGEEFLNANNITDSEDLYDFDMSVVPSRFLQDFRTEFIYNVRNYGYDDGEVPSWSFFEYLGVVKNQWLIHFSDDAWSIAKYGGFKHGMPNMEMLGLTTNYNKKMKSGGYNFAYKIDDFDSYGADHSMRRKGYKYGRDAVLFQASGVYAWHYSDQEPQVIFWGPSARNIISIEDGETKEWAVSDLSGNRLYEANDLSDIVDWVERHWQQYRSAILGKGKDR